ncbi:MAG TPA: acylneuraminate cytidylyltransferase family protein [bacterium (Candidatus Stahlbacteria)]|nr:acylneuraminate cytidylyltransferase family protein [Candidatus Stahlbacteria bacterium]
MTTIATICARGGSVGVPRKNIKLLLGKPLICHTIEQALSCAEIDYVFVSTDDNEIADVARKAGATIPLIRPSELAESSTPKLDVINHLVKGVEEKMDLKITRIVDLDPTSPLRTVKDIEACMNMLDASADVVITAYKSDKNPYFNMVEVDHDGRAFLVKSVPGGVAARQEAPVVYSMNASIYVWHRDSLNKGLWEGNTRLYEMPRERSIDIDELLDFKIVELLMREQS